MGTRDWNTVEFDNLRPLTLRERIYIELCAVSHGVQPAAKLMHSRFLDKSITFEELLDIDMPTFNKMSERFTESLDILMKASLADDRKGGPLG